MQAALEPMLLLLTPTQPWQFVSKAIFELDHKHERAVLNYGGPLPDYSYFYELEPVLNPQSPPS